MFMFLWQPKNVFRKTKDLTCNLIFDLNIFRINKKKCFLN